MAKSIARTFTFRCCLKDREKLEQNRGGYRGGGGSEYRILVILPPPPSSLPRGGGVISISACSSRIRERTVPHIHFDGFSVRPPRHKLRNLLRRKFGRITLASLINLSALVDASMARSEGNVLNVPPCSRRIRRRSDFGSGLMSSDLEV
jgi:hypothetical protein